MTQATIYVHDQNGAPIPGASVGINDGDFGSVASGGTDANGYYISPDLPFPTNSGSEYYTINADYYAATNTALALWYGDTGVIDMLLNIAGATHYDITVIAYQGGTTNPPPGNYSGDGVIYVTAVPYAGNVFDHWNLNGVFLTSDPTFHTGSTGTFEAFFTASIEGTSLSFDASPTSGVLPFISSFSGKLSGANNVGIAGKTIRLQVYSQPQGAFMDTVFTYQTDGNGAYSGSLSWQAPQVTLGEYRVRTRYAGD